MKNRIICTILSAVFLSVGWLGVSGLPLLVALVPLLLISHGYDSSRRSFWKMYGWTALSLGSWHLATAWWVWYATPIGVIAPFIVMLVMFGGVFMLYHYISKRAPAPLAYTVLVAGWIAAEYLYTIHDISFPWLTLGNGFAGDIKLIQWYDTTGIFGGSLWVWVCNLLVFQAIISRRYTYWIAPAAFVVIPSLISLTKYYTYRETGETVKVEVIQPNIDPYFEKFVASQESQRELLLRMSAKSPADVDFIVLPETALDDRLWEHTFEGHRVIGQLSDFMKDNYPAAQMVIGAMTYRYYATDTAATETARTGDGYWYDVYNTALAIDSTGVTDIHHKTKLVVAAENMPFKKIVKYLEFLIVDLGGTTGQLGFDTVRKVFTGPRGIKSGTAICYESIYGEYYSEFVQNGAQVMFIITNDGWWRDTPGYRQHFSFARLRAVETRRSIGRSANTGISGFINQRGDVISRTGWEERVTLTGEIALNDHITFYSRYGDYIARLSALVFGLCLLYYIAYRIKKRQHLVD